MDAATSNKVKSKMKLNLRGGRNNQGIGGGSQNNLDDYDGQYQMQNSP